MFSIPFYANISQKILQTGPLRLAWCKCASTELNSSSITVDILTSSSLPAQACVYGSCVIYVYECVSDKLDKERQGVGSGEVKPGDKRKEMNE